MFYPGMCFPGELWVIHHGLSDLSLVGIGTPSNPNTFRKEGKRLEVPTGYLNASVPEPMQDNPISSAGLKNNELTCFNCLGIFCSLASNSCHLAKEHIFFLLKQLRKVEPKMSC